MKRIHIFSILCAAVLLLTAPSLVGAQGMAEVKGTVLLPNGDPAKDAEVYLYPVIDGVPDYEDEKWMYADDYGDFWFEDLNAGMYGIEIDPPEDAVGVLPLYDLPVNVTSPDACVDLGEVTLPAATKQIRGTVERDGIPLPGVGVGAFNLDSWVYVYTYTNALGEFELVVGGSEWEVEVEPVSGADWVYNAPPAIVFFADDDSSETGVVTLSVQTADSALTGRVIMPDGNPLPMPGDAEPGDTVNYGASIDLWSADTDSYNYAYLDNLGNFNVPAVAGRYEVEVWLDDAEYPDWMSPIIGVLEVNTTTVNLGDVQLVARNALITGTVVDTNGAPLSGIYIDTWQEGEAYGYAETDGNGCFAIRVSAGEWLVAPDTDDAENYMFEGHLNTLSVVPSSVVTVAFTMTEMSGIVSGTIVDQSGQRLVDVQAMAYARRADSPEFISTAAVERGAFSLKVPEGELRVGLVLEPGSGYAFTAEVAPTVLKVRQDWSTAAMAATELAAYEKTVVVPKQGGDRVTITLERADAHITGVLRDAAGGLVTGISGAVAVAPHSSGAAWQWGNVNESDGSFTFDVAAGTWYLTYELNTDQYMDHPPEAMMITVNAEQTVQRDITLITLNETITGEVVDAADHPVPNTYVWVQGPSFTRLGLTDREGRFAINVPYGGADEQYRVGTLFKQCSLEDEGCLVDPPAQLVQTNPTYRGTAAIGPHAAFQSVRLKSYLSLPIPTGTFLYLEGRVTFTIPAGYDRATFRPDWIAGRQEYWPWLWFVNRQLDNQTTNQNEIFFSNWPIWAWTWDVHLFFNSTVTWARNCRYVNTGYSYTVRCDAEKKEQVTVDSAIKNLQPVRATASAGSVHAMTDTYAVALEVVGEVPWSEWAKFEVADGWSHTLSDGAQIHIPPNAIPTNEKEVRVFVEAGAAQFPNAQYRLGTYGYAISIYEDESGKKIAQDLKTNMILTLRYDEARLAEFDMDESEILPAQYAAELWQPAKSYHVNIELNKVTIQTQKLGNWALIAPQITPRVHVYLPAIMKSQ